jgi:hypothetical protein
MRPAWDWFDPIHGVGYQWWSGLGGAVALGVVLRVTAWLLPTRCAQLGCRRRARAVTVAGVPFCTRHLPE